RTIDDICNESSENTLEVYRLLFGVFANKLVEVVPEEELIVHEMKEEAKRGTAIGGPKTTFKQDTRLLISSQAGLTYRDVLKVTLARLTLKKGESDKKTFPLIEQEYFIGRQHGNQIHISDPSISNVHARIFKGPEGYVLEDLNSRNGSF